MTFSPEFVSGIAKIQEKKGIDKLFTYHCVCLKFLELFENNLVEVKLTSYKQKLNPLGLQKFYMENCVRFAFSVSVSQTTFLKVLLLYLSSDAPPALDGTAAHP